MRIFNRISPACFIITVPCEKPHWSIPSCGTETLNATIVEWWVSFSGHQITSTNTQYLQNASHFLKNLTVWTSLRWYFVIFITCLYIIQYLPSPVRCWSLLLVSFNMSLRMTNSVWVENEKTCRNYAFMPWKVKLNTMSNIFYSIYNME